MTRSRLLPAFAAFNAMLALTFGTFAVHGIRDPQARDWVITGVFFQLPHVAAVFALLAWRDTPPVRLAGWMLAFGSFIFAGVLSALAVGAPRALAAIAPAGGTMMMLGWAWVAVLALGAGRLDRLWAGRREEETGG